MNGKRSGETASFTYASLAIDFFTLAMMFSFRDSLMSFSIFSSIVFSIRSVLCSAFDRVGVVALASFWATRGFC